MRQILAPLLDEVNSAACCADNSRAHNPLMNKDGKSKKAVIEPVHVEEAARLKEIYSAYVTKQQGAGTRISQEAFGAMHDIGNQSMVWQYLNGKSPLNPPAAIKFANAVGCKVEDFSPRIAEWIKRFGLSPEHIDHGKFLEKKPISPKLRSLFDQLLEQKDNTALIELIEHVVRVIGTTNQEIPPSARQECEESHETIEVPAVTVEDDDREEPPTTSTKPHKKHG